MRFVTALRWAPAILHAALLFVLSSQPELRIADEPALDTILRKMGHLGAYATLSLAVAWALGGVGRDRRAATALALVVAYAITDEIHQAFVPGRGPSVSDVLIDGAGGLLGIIVAWQLGERRRGSHPRLDDLTWRSRR